MRKILAVFTSLFCIATAHAQQPNETFNAFVNGLPPAAGIGPTDMFYLLQGANSRKVALGSSPLTITGLWAFSTSPTVPTPTFGDNSTNAASTAFVQSAVSGISGIATTGALATPTALAGATIGTNVTVMTVLAMASSGTSTCSLNFTKGTSSPTGIFGEVLNTPSSIYWEPQYSTDPIRACEWGTIADGSVVQNFTSGATTFSGTDNTAIIQAAINYGIQNKHNTVCLNGGNYRTTDTLHLGWGDSFYAINLDACNFNVSSVTAGVNIYADGIGDRCGVNIQGGRGSGFHHISLYGLNYTWAFASSFPNPWPTTASGWLLPALIPTGTNPGGLTRYAPYGGICEDAYSGQPPSALGANAQYPFVTPPAFTTLITTAASIAPASGPGTNAVVTWGVTQHWLTTNCNTLALSGNCPIIFTSGSPPAGISLNTLYYVSNFVSGTTFNISATPGGSAITISASASGLTASRQFGMNFSSQSTVNDGQLNGFAVNLNWGSHTTNSQGDFLHVYNVNSSFCVYCFSVGNDQSRNVEISDSQFALCYAAVTNQQFGERVGLLGGPINNLSGGECYEAFDIGAQSFGFPVIINTFYAEALTRFMNLGVASTPNGIIVNGCQVSLGVQGIGSPNVTLPVAFMEMGGAPVTLNDCSFTNGAGRIDVLAHGSSGSLTLNGGSWSMGTIALPAINLPGIQVGYNYVGGLLVSGTASVIAQNGNNVSNGVVFRDPIFATKMQSQTSLSGSQQMKSGADFTSNGVRAIYTQATQGFFELTNRTWRQFASAPPVGSPNLSSATYTTVPAAISSCDVLTFTYKQSGINVGTGTINVGDILYWQGDGTIFVVTNVAALTGGAYPYTAKQMNNMVVNGTTGACVTNNINDPTLAGTTTIIHAAGTLYLDVLNAAVVATPGSGYTPGTQTLTATGGTCTTEPQFIVTVNAAGFVTAVTANTVPAVCSVPPTNPVTMTGGGGTGATLNLISAPDNIRVPQALFYTDTVSGLSALNNISLNGTSATPNGATIETWMKPGDILWAQILSDPAFPWFPPLLGVANNLSTLGPLTDGTSSSAGSAFVNGAPVMSGRMPLAPLPLVGVGQLATRTPILFSNGATAVAQATTAFQGFLSNATEANVTLPCPVNGYFKSLNVTATAPASGQTLAATMRVNGSDTALTCTVTGPASTCSDTNGAHAAACPAGQLFSLKTVTSATTGSLTAVNGSAEFVHQ